METPTKKTEIEIEFDKWTNAHSCNFCYSPSNEPSNYKPPTELCKLCKAAFSEGFLIAKNRYDPPRSYTEVVPQSFIPVKVNTTDFPSAKLLWELAGEEVKNEEKEVKPSDLLNNPNPNYTILNTNPCIHDLIDKIKGNI
jgi:hypothetical protein